MTKTSNPQIAYDATISLWRANVIAFALFPVVYFLFFVPYQLIWNEYLISHFFGLRLLDFLVIILILGVSILIHEWLHALGFMWFGKAPRSSVRYGFSWKGMAPYAHCQAPMKASAYRFGVAVPGLILGLIPGIAGLLIGAWWLVGWAALMLVAAGGDLAVLWAIRRVPGKAVVQDHQAKVGCQVLA